MKLNMGWTIRGAVFVVILIGLAVARFSWPERLDAWVIMLFVLGAVATLYPNLLRLIGGKVKQVHIPGGGGLDLSGDPETEKYMKLMQEQIPDPSKIPSREGVQQFDALRTKQIFLEDADGQYRGFVGSVGERTMMSLGAENAPRLSFTSNPTGTGTLTLHDASGVLRAGILVTGEGASIMLGKGDKIRAWIKANDHAPPKLELFDDSGRSRAKLTFPPPSLVDAVQQKRTTLLTRPPSDLDSDEVNP